MAQDPVTDAPEDLYLTVSDDDENQVLELVRITSTDMFIRHNGQWAPIDPDDDNDRVWDRIIIDVTPDAVPVFDSAEAAGSVTADLFDSYKVDDTEGDAQ